MARRLRIAVGGVVYHVINRRVGRQTLFVDDGDYLAFEKVLADAAERVPGARLASYCLMPNHWHLVLWPRWDDDLPRFMQWLTVTHMRRWHAHRGSAGEGPVYQGRYKSFPVQADGHFRVVCRYVERNPLRAGLVRRAERWPWCSLARRLGKDVPEWLLPQGEWPVEVREADWVEWVNGAQTPAEVEALRRSVNRGQPFGDAQWQRRTARRLKLESSLHDPWRPRKAKPGKEPRKGAQGGARLRPADDD